MLTILYLQTTLKHTRTIIIIILQQIDAYYSWYTVVAVVWCALSISQHHAIEKNKVTVHSLIAQGRQLVSLQ